MTSYEIVELASARAEITRVALAGELDLVDASGLEERLAAIAGECLVVDLNGVVFADSAALRCLFGLAARRGRSRLAFVVGADAPIAKIVEIVGLERAAHVVRTEQEALDALAPGA